jgi:hypothetical protein
MSLMQYPNALADMVVGYMGVSRCMLAFSMAPL